MILYTYPGSVRTMHAIHIKGWPEPYIYGICPVSLAGKLPNIQPNTAWFIHGFNQPYICKVCKVGQNRIYTPYMTVYLVVSLPKIPCIHRINIDLANPKSMTPCAQKLPSVLN
jgi:hypothetical protein